MSILLTIVTTFKKIRQMYRRIGLRPVAIAAFTAAISYRGGFWLTALHKLEGATEQNEPPLLIHWLRDSTLMAPLVFAAVLISLLLARWLAVRFLQKKSELLTGIIVILTIAIATAFAETAASPLHNLVFQANDPHQTHNHSGIGKALSAEHLAYDGFLVLPANLLITAVVFALLGGRVWSNAPGETGIEKTAAGSPFEAKRLNDPWRNMEKNLREAEQPTLPTQHIPGGS